MRESHKYPSSNYVRDHGFVSSWIFRKLFLKGAQDTITAEASEYSERNSYHQKNIGGGKKIIGKPAGKEVRKGQTGSKYGGQSQRDDSKVGGQVMVEEKHGEKHVEVSSKEEQGKEV